MSRMLSGASKTPRYAAFFCSATLIAGCGTSGGPEALPESACASPGQPIAAVQGTGSASPMVGAAVTVRGIATYVEPGRGVYLEELASDEDPATSNALFLEMPGLAGAVRPGDRIAVAGTVTELGDGPETLTALSAISAMRTCESGVPLPVTDSRLPLGSPERVALESMRLSFRQSLAVTDIYRLGQGQIGLSPSRILPAPTEVARPGADARRQAQRNRMALLSVQLDPGDTQPYAVGATVMAAEGVLGHDGQQAILLADQALSFVPAQQFRHDAPAADELRVVSLNLRNYFNGDGAGGGFPTPRGASTPEAFEAQRERLVAGFGFLKPHLLAVMELENDGFGPRSAAADLLRDLQAGTGQPWAVVDPFGRPIGTGQITVGLFYRPDVLRPVGPAEALDSEPFRRLSRQPLAQVFAHTASGVNFLVAVNHLKSKGSCPDDGPNANNLDGQGCWNRARTEAAREMAEWVRQLAARLAGGRALVVGDMNAYRMEDPIQAIIGAGFKDLTASIGLRHEYTFVYRGEAGTLDYAFASPGLQPAVRSGRVLNINAGYPLTGELALPWLGASDHDPVVVDLRLEAR